MTARSLIGAEIKVLGSAKVASNGTTEVNFDFGTPNDLYLPSLAGFKSGDRVVVLFDASRAAGTTDTITFKVYDADDSSGSIGTPAAATTNTSGSMAGAATGDHYAVVGVQLKSGRPWLRCSAVSSGGTDAMVLQCTVLAIPAGF